MKTDCLSVTALKTVWAVSRDQERAIGLAALARQALIAEAELTHTFTASVQ